MTAGTFVWICDDDDLLRPGSVDRMVVAIEREGVDLAFGRYTRFHTAAGVRQDMGTGYWPHRSRGSLARHILEDAFVMHNAALVWRTAYGRAGPFDPAMLRSQDYEMFVRLAFQASMTYVDEIVFDQRKHDGVRGPAQAAHRARQSNSMWERYDRLIFAKLREAVPPSYFEGMFEAGYEPIIRRAALLQRGCVMARHGMWAEALDDFEGAGQIGPAIGLQSLERDICRRAVAGKHGFSGMLDKDISLRLRRLRKSCPAGKAIFSWLTRGTLRRLRGADNRARLDAIGHLLSPVALMSAILVGG